MSEVKQFKATGMGNEYVEMDGFALSFNPSPGMGFSMFQGDTDDGETAIVKDGKFFILNGDHRDEYLSRETYEGCRDYFLSRPELKSS